MKNDLNERLFIFASKCLRFLRTIPNETEYRVIKYQLAKSSTSAGANYEESQAGSSLADFHNKVKISLREMRETNYWLRLLNSLADDNLKTDKLNWLINESRELKNILGSIIQKTRKK